MRKNTPAVGLGIKKAFGHEGISFHNFNMLFQQKTMGLLVKFGPYFAN